MPVDETILREQEAEVRQLLRQLIVASGQSQQDLEDELGVAHGYLSRLLAGKKRLTFRHVQVILQLTHVGLSDFLRLLAGRGVGTQPGSLGLRRHPAAELPLLMARKGLRPRATEPQREAPPIDPEQLKREILAAVESVVDKKLAGLSPRTTSSRSI